MNCLEIRPAKNSLFATQSLGGVYSGLPQLLLAASGLLSERKQPVAANSNDESGPWLETNPGVKEVLHELWLSMLQHNAKTELQNRPASAETAYFASVREIYSPAFLGALRRAEQSALLEVRGLPALDRAILRLEGIVHGASMAIPDENTSMVSNLSQPDTFLQHPHLTPTQNTSLPATESRYRSPNAACLTPRPQPYEIAQANMRSKGRFTRGAVLRKLATILLQSLKKLKALISE